MIAKNKVCRNFVFNPYIYMYDINIYIYDNELFL